MNSLNVNQDPSGSIRTFLVFLDLPIHMEFLIGHAPLFNIDTKIDFQELSLKDPKNPQRIRKISGVYRVNSRKLTYRANGSKGGFSQYLEMIPDSSNTEKPTKTRGSNV